MRRAGQSWRRALRGLLSPMRFHRRSVPPTTIDTSSLLGRAECHDRPPRANDVYRGRTVMITGAGGTIGSELCRQLLQSAPRRLVLLEWNEFALYTIERALRALADGTGTEIVPVLASISDEGLIRQTLSDQQVAVILHAAAYKHVPMVEANPVAGIDNNVMGTARLLRQARAARIDRFVLISSDKAVRPTSIMGASKRMAELLVQDQASRGSGTVFSIVRFGNVLGSSGSVVPLFQEQIAMGGPVTLTDAAATRYFMTRQEAVQLVLTAGNFARGGEVFVLDMGMSVAVENLARKMIEAAGKCVRDAANPTGEITIKITGLRPGEKLHEEQMVRPGDKPTPHRKIFSVQSSRLSELETAATLRDLKQALVDCDGARACDCLWNRVGDSATATASQACQ